MSKQEQSANGCAIAGLATAFIGVFLLGGIMGIATIVFGALGTKGSAWAKVLGILEIIIGVIYVLVMLFYISMF